MIKPVFQIITIIVPMLLILSVCSTVQAHSETSSSSIVVKELDSDTHSWNGALLPQYPKGQPQITLLRISIPPKATLRTHRHPVINAAVLISGRLTVKTLDGQTLYLEAGDSLIELVNTWHYGINTGEVPADIIVFYADVVGTPITLYQPQPETDDETNQEIKKLFLNSTLVDCVGISPQKCMQVKENESEEWRFFYDEIENFTFEEGYFHEIIVEIINVENPPADSSSKKYMLIEIISKEEFKVP